MPSEPKPIDLTTLSKQELRNLLDNAKRRQRDDIIKTVIQELTRRGKGQTSDYDLLEWNQASVRKLLEPFVEIAKTVPDNQRTTYTEAGGMKIGRSRDDPEWRWVDTYSAIKTPRLNAAMVCFIDRPGEDAYLHLYLDGVVVTRYELSDVPVALKRWRELAEQANG